jgi:DNA-binding transcriptional LysR family regulator
MELHQLEYFVAVAEEANFTRAAAKMHVAQPGVSAQIRRLEREFCHSLFDRSGRSVTLTAVGAAVLPYARAALSAVEAAKHAVDELTGLVRGRVTVGMVTVVAPVNVPDLLADFHSRHPDVEITLVEANSSVLVESLQQGELDLAFVGLSMEPPEGLRAEVVADEPLVAVVSVHDQLAAQDSVTLAQVQDRRLICLPRGTGTRTALDSALAKAGQRPRIAFEASDPGVLVQLAGRGFGIAILPEPLAGAAEPAVEVLAISEPPLRTRIDLVWRSAGPLSPAARALIQHARSSIRRRAAAGSAG